MKAGFKKRFLEISDFLKNYKIIHEVEFLKRYPEEYPKFILPWIEELIPWSFPELASFESTSDKNMVKNPSFKIFLDQIDYLSNIGQLKVNETILPSEYLRKMNIKKRHEIQTLKSLIDSDSQSDYLIDIGGGAGHLSCALLYQNKKESLCLDLNSDLKTSGERKVKRWLPQIEKQIIFSTAVFDDSTNLPHNFSPNETTLIGLHSCGSLSTSIIKRAVQDSYKGLYNFGCCYHKLIDEYNISMLAKEFGVKLTNNALHLAGRSGTIVSEQDLKTRFKVKRFRYSLHYFLNDHFKTPFRSIGNATKEDYNGEFTQYARKYDKNCELAAISDETLQNFYRSESVQLKVKRNFIADIIRLKLGRLIELYILLDRALFIQENGKLPELVECFNKKLSPRNILLRF